jgi:hypothetical protein
MDPVRKFIARRQTPWKLMIQFLKIILVWNFSVFTFAELFFTDIFLSMNPGVKFFNLHCCRISYRYNFIHELSHPT